ncbi:c-type cytochrome [Aurantiacibacter aquimixticola]|uniref:Cytochrome c domain-containing protein n=1 Tax=Aurantiacibacter aquimixticola TaxID=1958945 RepID=A0A419RTB2_9SPHN|nr:c-type cytochrome [Aurantiacibacter aquimixticola]RJY09020.1 hypothetical protein D6201_06265 [Aurantiacibacter aquimixticola]
MKKSVFVIIVACFGLGSCQHAPESVPVAPEYREAHALAQAACAGCHSVEPYGLSPNPAAPEFPRIANARGLTRDSLANWLTEAHNYPEQMDFYLDEEEVETLSAYILTLRREDYHPPY